MRLVVERLKEVDLKAQTVRAAVNLESSWTDSAEPLCGGGPVRVDSIDMAGGRFTVHSDAEHCFFTPRLVLKNQLSVETPRSGCSFIRLSVACAMSSSSGTARWT